MYSAHTAYTVQYAPTGKTHSLSGGNKNGKSTSGKHDATIQSDRMPGRCAMLERNDEETFLMAHTTHQHTHRQARIHR